MAKDENRVVARELRQRNDAELRSLLGTKVEELHRVRFKQALGQLSQTHLLKTHRREIARLRTILNERKEQQA